VAIVHRDRGGGGFLVALAPERDHDPVPANRQDRLVPAARAFGLAEPAEQPFLLGFGPEAHDGAAEVLQHPP
jgi:hypothetical protein